MPRKRMIDPEFWSDEEIGNWSLGARLLYIGLWNFADDEGRFKADIRLLKSQIFPYDKRIIMTSLMQEIAIKVQLYEHNGAHYGFIMNFKKHQRIDRPTPSRLPPPPKIDELSTRTQRPSKVNISKDKLSKDKYSAKADLESLRMIVDYYKEIKGYMGIEGWDNSNYSRFAKIAKRLLEIPLIVPAIKKLIDWTDKYSKEHNLDWTLDTCIKYYGDWKLGKPAKKMTKSERENIEDLNRFYIKHKDEIDKELEVAENEKK